jgi:hypothetical protein
VRKLQIKLLCLGENPGLADCCPAYHNSVAGAGRPAVKFFCIGNVPVSGDRNFHFALQCADIFPTGEALEFLHNCPGMQGNQIHSFIFKATAKMR